MIGSRRTLLSLVAYFVGLVWVNNALADDKNHLVLLLSRLGLANRLRAMADWHQIAQESGRHLTVSWEPTVDCNVSFFSLFKDVPEGLTVLEQPLASGENSFQEAATRAKQDAHAQGLSFKVLPRHDGGPSNFIQPGFNTFIISRASLFDPAAQVLFTDHDGLVALAGVPCQRYTQLRSHFYAELKPVDDIAQYVDEVYRTYFARKMLVGVHVRLHDADYDWSVVPPGRKLQNHDASSGQETPMGAHGETEREIGAETGSALVFGEGASLEHFQSVMTAIERQFRSRYGSATLSTPRLERGNLEEDGAPDTPIRFFVASNDQKAKDYFIQHFPAAIALSGPTSVGGMRFSRSSTSSMRFALIEWLLLSRASLLLHTYGSSFAEEAAAKNRIPLIGAWADINVLHHHDALPYCGHPQFMRAYAQQGWEGSIEEDLHTFEAAEEAEERKADKRTVSGKSFLILPCPMLDDWAIPDLYCFQDDHTAADAGSL